MVLSLVDLSLLSIANGLEDGTIQNPHFLPPKLRQRVLDTVLKRGLINDPKCLALLSSVEFLNGMESFGTEPGNYELEFLNRLKESMATVLPNGETVGAGIRKLNLSVYGFKKNFQTYVWRPDMASSFRLVSQMINQCPNTTSLALHGIKSEKVLENRPQIHRGMRYSSWFPSVLNENDASTTIMENLVQLSLRDMKKVLSADRPMINFNRLTTLKLEDCSIQVDMWPEFLRNLRTVENLHMIGVKCVEEDDNLEWRPNVYGLDWILPISMPRLKSLEILSIEYDQFIYECNKAFVDNLMGCPEIRRVKLSLDQKSTDEKSMERLASMNVDLTVKVRFTVERENEEIRAALDSSSKFKLIRIFHGMMDSFELNVWREWSPELSTALKDVIDSCSHLTTFGLHIPHKFHFGATEIDPVDMIRINDAMIQFLGTWERAMQLNELYLWGNFDEIVVLSIFEYCLNLDRLDISYCPTVRDQHLINWVSIGGGKLTHLEVSHCRNVTSEGIIPILAKSAEGLLFIYVRPNRASGDGRYWQTRLKNLCPVAIAGN